MCQNLYCTCFPPFSGILSYFKILIRQLHFHGKKTQRPAVEQVLKEVSPPSDEFIKQITEQLPISLPMYEAHLHQNIPQQQEQEYCESYALEVELKISYQSDIPITCLSTLPVVNSDHALSEFIKCEERCLKFVNQDLNFLQPSNIPSVSKNVLHDDNSPVQVSQSQTQVASSIAKLPTHTSKDQNSTPPTQIVEPVLGLMPAEIQRAEAEPKLTVEQLLTLESCKEYVQTPIQTLDGIQVHQPCQFLPLAKEAKKLVEALKKEQDASQWADISPKNLFQESFVEQLNSLQTIEQLAPLQAAKEYLPQDIINILELLGKVDNIPFNQMYSLAEDCTDWYYTKVIKTLTQLLKGSFNDRQTILVNMARTLKFLELYGNRQTKIWKVLSKNDKLPDHFHDLQTTLQTEFNFLKKATLRNIENLHDTINLQQSYTTSLCSHVNTIYTKLAQLDKQIQTHCLYPHSQTDSLQINAPEYDSDIDGQIDTLPDIQPQVPSHAENTEED